MLIAIETTQKGIYSNGQSSTSISLTSMNASYPRPWPSPSRTAKQTMTADVLTKAIEWEKFERFRSAAGVEKKDSAHLGLKDC
jgi:hypothetical protein